MFVFANCAFSNKFYVTYVGMSLPYSSSSPADSKEKIDECKRAGEAMKVLLEKDIKPRDIMTKGAFENAIRMVMMTGGSTNAVLHLIAMSRSCQNPDVAITLDDFQRLSDVVSTSCCHFILLRLCEPDV
jgi:dihydroxy-acid dehydratase